MVTYEELLQAQYIKKLEKLEKEKYVLFHHQNYTLDLASAIQFIEAGNAKYAAIAGYYGMLNCTLWYHRNWKFLGHKKFLIFSCFAKYFNLKISKEQVGVHTNCLIVLHKFVKDQRLKEKIIILLEEAKKEYLSFTILKTGKEQTLPLLLHQGADKRRKYTYYSTEKSFPDTSQQLQEARNFVENIVKPYISIMEKLQC